MSLSWSLQLKYRKQSTIAINFVALTYTYILVLLLNGFLTFIDVRIASLLYSKCFFTVRQTVPRPQRFHL